MSIVENTLMKVPFVSSFRRFASLAVFAFLALSAASAHASYVTTVLSDNPLGYWQFEETSGATAADSSGNMFDASYDVGVVLGAAGAPGTGGNSASFSNVGNSGVDLPGTWGGPSMSAVTIEAWVNVATDTLDFQAVVSADTTDFAHFQLHTIGVSGTYVDAAPGEAMLVPLSTSPMGVWRHVALVSESGNTRLYENGVQVGASNANTFSNITASSNVDIGRGFGGGREFDGLIDEVAIYDTALSESQLRNHYNAATQGMLAHYTFDAGGADSSGAGNHGTLGGGATITGDAIRGGGALDLRGVNGYVDIVGPVLNGQDQYTITMWVNADSTALGCCDALFTNDSWGGGRVHVHLDNGLATNAVSDTSPWAQSESAIPLGEWVHIAFTYDSVDGVSTPYVNGIAQSSTLHTLDILAGLGGTTIGAWDGSRFFNGRIDDVRVYGYLLSSEQIFALTVPEPSTWAMGAVIALFGLMAGYRKRRSRQ
ncbi:MAG: LamG-like jellyroll fold domain-containing protein [Pirellulales bacterium]